MEGLSTSTGLQVRLCWVCAEVYRSVTGHDHVYHMSALDHGLAQQPGYGVDVRHDGTYVKSSGLDLALAFPVDTLLTWCGNSMELEVQYTQHASVDDAVYGELHPLFPGVQGESSTLVATIKQGGERRVADMRRLFSHRDIKRVICKKAVQVDPAKVQDAWVNGKLLM